jgi:4'-phosphopantetheinyl transferase
MLYSIEEAPMSLDCPAIVAKDPAKLDGISPALPALQVCLIPCQDQDVQAQMSLLAPQELQRLSTLTNQAMCDRYVLTRAAVRVLLSRCVPSVPPRRWQFTRAAYGRPELAGSTARADLSFNIAHTANQIVLALSVGGSVGVDIEDLMRKTDGMALARRYFMPAEVAALETLPAALRHQRFLEFWTLKEACVKATGEGLGRGLRQAGFVLNDAAGIAMLPVEPADTTHWQFWQWSLAGAHLVAVALRGGAADLQVSWMRLHNLQTLEISTPTLLRASASVQARMYSSTNLEP